MMSRERTLPPLPIQSLRKPDFKVQAGLTHLPLCQTFPPEKLLNVLEWGTKAAKLKQREGVWLCRYLSSYGLTATRR